MSRKKPIWLKSRELANTKRKAESKFEGYLSAEYSQGFSDGVMSSLPGCIQLCYAAAIMALKKEFNSDNDTCEKYLLTFADILTNEIDSEEAAEKVFKETGIKILTNEALDFISKE